MNPLIWMKLCQKIEMGGIIGSSAVVGQIGNAIIDTVCAVCTAIRSGEDWHFYQVVKQGDVLVSRPRRSMPSSTRKNAPPYEFERSQ